MKANRLVMKYGVSVMNNRICFSLGVQPGVEHWNHASLFGVQDSVVVAGSVLIYGKYSIQNK